MKVKILLSILILIILTTRAFSGSKSTDRFIEYDIYNRIIKDSAGNKINYPILSMPIASSLKQTNSASTNTVIGTPLTNCSSAWNYTIMGTEIGVRSLKSTDIDNDGTIESVMGARFGNGSYWYILTYDSITHGYFKSFVSDYFDNKLISCMGYYDVDNDSILEIFVGYTSGDIYIFDAGTKAQVGQFVVNAFTAINDIEIGDVDNNGTLELVASTDNNMFFYSALTYSFIAQSTNGAYNFKIGNVDADATNEIVTSKGDVLQFNGSGTSLQWHFQNSTYNKELIALSDIDLDGKKEIIKTVLSDSVNVYDADIQSLKFAIPITYDIGALVMLDLNNDGKEEIIFGDGQWGNIHCYNPVTHTQMWQLNNNGYGTNSLSIADTDNDGDKDMLWSSGANSTAGDTLYIYNLNTLTRNWKSKAIDGPYYAMAVDDIDNDGSKEIVAISYESASGYRSGVLSIFDAGTHVLEWESDGIFFNSVWTGIYDLEIKDIDNNGDKEIIVAAGQTYTGKIWIVDGTTKVIQSSHLFQTENLDEFYSLAIEDVDSDGNLEIVAINDQVNIINPATYAIEWKSTSFPGGNASITKIANIDADTALEIITCRANYWNGASIYVTDGISHAVTHTLGNNYNCFDLYDMNQDGIKDIIAGTYNGQIDVINGLNFQVISSTTVSSSPIDGILVASLDADTVPEKIFGSEGRLCFQSSQGILSYTEKKFGVQAGYTNSIQVVDVDNDGKKEIFFGTSISIQEIHNDCIQCVSFAGNINRQNVSCTAPNNGSIQVNANGAHYPVSYSWNTGSTDSILVNLPIGNYSFTMVDALGCTINDTIQITQAALLATVMTDNVNCNNTVLGSALVNVNVGVAPFSYLWSNGSTSATASNLNKGIYSVTVTDALQCVDTIPFQVYKDTINIYGAAYDVSCFGLSNGHLSVYVLSNNPPYSINWLDGHIGWNLYNLAAGNYIYQISDAGGCVSSDTIVIHAPASPININVTTIPDDPNTPGGDGGATVSANGGTPPYTVNWSDPFLQTTPTVVNLAPGTYTVTIRDAMGCFSQATVQIWVIGIHEAELLTDFSITPNPNNGIMKVKYNIQFAKKASIRIVNLSGQKLSEMELELNKNSLVIEQPQIASGMYFYKLLINDQVIKTGKLVIDN